MTNPQKRVREIFVDAAVVVGFGLLTYGAAIIYSPAGFIVPGVLLLAVGVIGARR